MLFSFGARCCISDSWKERDVSIFGCDRRTFIIGGAGGAGACYGESHSLVSDCRRGGIVSCRSFHTDVLVKEVDGWYGKR